jgi:hypothetical protein
MTSKEDSSSSSLEPLAVEHFVEKVIGDFAAASNFIMAAIGDKLGLYRAMAGFSDDADSNNGTISNISFTSHELANKTGTNERDILENGYANKFVRVIFCMTRQQIHLYCQKKCHCAC